MKYLSMIFALMFTVAIVGCGDPHEQPLPEDEAHVEEDVQVEGDVEDVPVDGDVEVPPSSPEHEINQTPDDWES